MTSILFTQNYKCFLSAGYFNRQLNVRLEMKSKNQDNNLTVNGSLMTDQSRIAPCLVNLKCGT